MNNIELNDLVKLSFFAEIGKAITSTTTIDQTLKEVMNQIGNTFSPLYWSLMLRDFRTGNLKFTIVIGSGVEKLKDMVIPKGKGIAGWIAETGETVLINNVSNDSRFDSTFDEITKFKTQSIIGVPLKNKDKVFGVIELVNKLNKNSFTPLELKILSIIADFAAIAIEKAYYFSVLKKLATIDPLTGVNNRRAFIEYLEREKERVKRHNSAFSVVMIDIDNFKEINDTYGHITGDIILKALCNILKQSVRKVDIVCRYGGDEFVIIMPDSKKEAAEEAKQRIIKNIDVYNTKSKIKFNISIGLYDSSMGNISNVLNIADMEMYKEKSKKLEQHIEDLSANIEELLSEEIGENK